MAQAARAATAVAGAVKEVKGKVRLLVLSGEAKPGPAIGQSLGPLGLNMAEFCKQFNASTSKMKPGIPIPVRLVAFKDRTFTFTTQTPPTAWFLKKCANIEKGAAKPVLEVAGKVTLKQVYEIASIKSTDAHLAHISIESLCRSVVGSARSMGIDIISGKEDARARAASAAAAASKVDGSATPAAASGKSAGAAKESKSAPAAAAAKPEGKKEDSKAKPAVGGDDKKKKA